jgi:hypothetical protein
VDKADMKDDKADVGHLIYPPSNLIYRFPYEH